MWVMWMWRSTSASASRVGHYGAIQMLYYYYNVVFSVCTRLASCGFILQKVAVILRTWHDLTHNLFSSLACGCCWKKLEFLRSRLRSGHPVLKQLGACSLHVPDSGSCRKTLYWMLWSNVATLGVEKERCSDIVIVTEEHRFWCDSDLKTSADQLFIFWPYLAAAI